MSLRYLLVFLISTVCISAQAPDSLELAIKRTKNDIEKVRLLNEISYQYRTSDPNLMQQYAKQALKLAAEIGDETQRSEAILNLGTSFIILGNYKEALRHFADARNILEGIEDGAAGDSARVKKLLGRVYGSIGIVFSEQSNYAKALQYHLRAVKIFEDLQDEQGMARLYNNIGIVFHAQHNEFKALEYFSKAAEIHRRRNDPSLGITLTNIGNCYVRQEQLDKAISSYREALQILSIHPDARAEGELFNNLGHYHQIRGEYDAATESWENAIRKFASIDDKFGIADTYQHLAAMNFTRGNFRQAIEFSDKAVQLARQLEVVEQIAAAEKLMADSYARMNNDKQALIHLRNYIAAKEKLNDAEALRAAVQAEMNFEFDKREAIQRKEIEKKELIYEEAAKRHSLQIMFATLVSILLCGIAFLIYSRIQLKKNLTLQKELAEYEQKALHLQMNPHFVFNCLGSISSFIVQNGTDEAIRYLSKFSKLMRLTLEYSKESLIPIDREIESLQNYLELEQLRFNKMFNFNISKSNQIEDDMAIPPLLLQPFVENSIIHGLIPKASEGSIEIDFLLNQDKLVCTITDDGIGIEQSRILKEELVNVHKSMALDITRKRLQMMEAVTTKTSQVEIEELHDATGAVSGTRVVLTLPVQFISK
jgi:tetratricopeptide (TPR) repeat protein